MREAFDRGGDAWFGGPRADRRVLLCLARRPQSRCWRLQWSAVHGGSWSGGAYVQQAPRDPCLPPPRSQGFAVGMHAALQINPYYGKTSAAGLLRHLQAVLDEGPAIVYNVPGRTGQDIPTDVVLALAQHLNFLGVKECTGNGRIERYYEHGVLCWSGNDDEAHAGRHLHHAQGVISVTSNLLPGVFARLMQHRDDALADSLQDLIAWLFCEPNPIPLCALASGGGGRHVRSGGHAQAHMPPPPPPAARACAATLRWQCAAWSSQCSGCRTCRSRASNGSGASRCWRRWRSTSRGAVACAQWRTRSLRSLRGTECASHVLHMPHTRMRSPCAARWFPSASSCGARCVWGRRGVVEHQQLRVAQREQQLMHSGLPTRHKRVNSGGGVEVAGHSQLHHELQG